ncbi:hypothetical protein OAO87_04520 [bacterium]|nr:hypothetical protein [bacterium]
MNGLQKQREALAAAAAKRAEKRREGPVDKMQKADLATRISELFGEMPTGWVDFKRDELRTVVGSVFESIKDQICNGAAQLDASALHRTLVDLSERDALATPVVQHSRAFEQATYNARRLLAAAAPAAVQANPHHSVSRPDDPDLACLLLQAFVLPWLHKSTHQMGINFLTTLGWLLVILVAWMMRCDATMPRIVSHWRHLVESSSAVVWLSVVWPYAVHLCGLRETITASPLDAILPVACSLVAMRWLNVRTVMGVMQAIAYAATLFVFGRDRILSRSALLLESSCLLCLMASLEMGNMLLRYLVKGMLCWSCGGVGFACSAMVKLVPVR